MNAIVESYKQENRGECMNYLAAIACVVALVLINIFGTQSESTNSILSAAIMALVWGGVQRGSGKRDGETEEQENKKPAKK